jgi:hypothetical protein
MLSGVLFGHIFDKQSVVAYTVLPFEELSILPLNREGADDFEDHQTKDNDTGDNGLFDEKFAADL